MKNKAVILVLALMTGFAFTGLTQTDVASKKEQQVAAEKVEMYYFHYERRCATCQAVEDESQKALKELYPEQVKSGEMTFLSVNIEDETNKPLIDQFKVSGQTLLIVKGSKQENLTNTAFMHAKSNPGKLKKAIGEAVNKL